MTECRVSYMDRSALLNRATEEIGDAHLNRTGGVFFIAGEPGGGRTWMLDRIETLARAQSSEPAIIRAAFTKGRYVPQSSTGSTWARARKTVGAVGASMPLATPQMEPVVGGVVAFVGQVLQALAAIWEAADESRDSSHASISSADELVSRLREAASQKVVLCLIDDLDQAGDSTWADMLLTFGREVSVDLPLLLFVSLVGPPALGDRRSDEPRLHSVARHLWNDGIGAWWPLGPLSEDEIAAWTGPADRHVIRQLREATGGIPKLVDGLWWDWRRRQLVSRSNVGGRWRTSCADVSAMLPSAHKLIGDLLHRHIDTQSTVTAEDAYDLLACGALEGHQFTAAGIARVYGREVDEVIDLFDDYLIVRDERPDGLLLEDGWAQVHDPERGDRALARYAFRSDLHWLALRRYGTNVERLPRLSIGLARVLEDLYSPDRRLVAGCLAELFRQGGDCDRATLYQRTADRQGSSDTAAWRAQLIMAARRDGWEKLDYVWAAESLLTAAHGLERSWPHAQVLNLYREAHDLAAACGDDQLRAEALLGCGAQLIRLGGMGGAFRALDDARRLGHQLKSLEIEAPAWGQLGMIEYQTGRLDQALRCYDRASKLHEKRGDPLSLAISQHNMALVLVDQGECQKALKLCRDSLEVFERVRNFREMAACLLTAGKIHMRLSEDIPAEKNLWRAQKLAHEAAHGSAEAIAWHQLGLLAMTQSSFDLASQRLQKSLSLSIAMGDHTAQGTTFLVASQLASLRGRHEYAVQLAALAALLLRAVDHYLQEPALKVLYGAVSTRGHSPEIVPSLMREAKSAHDGDHGWSLMVAAMVSD